ncbi:protein mono-ADP-ribosyltransferase PARP9-like [Acipenser ruthenus]|uniref:protein mono-ADP-ribosyltransferase PARP9-like n=1 Tax=Acipenser ruthenus TaxID=7906 RepID=UPI00145A8772|nr:protein mono-ADP-ribosyltransferase PARP9-like [Acipenser ruthenus]XP_033856220.3 protein mono-ADP-ribosyltransferase PARP9-like [Acipenser ruthenus]XP_058888375.1 protein mono-ADP-ribosyltransferase PARP9-like [Acipenser ruthenus]
MMNMNETSIQVPIDSEIAQTLSESVGLSDVVRSKFGCDAVLKNGKAIGSHRGAGSFKPEIRYSKTLDKGLKISVWKDDLTTHKVDAVVNAANAGLQHYGGLADALSVAGGPTIQKMSDEIIRRNGSVPTGEAVVTTAGRLPCKMIIHAVGPQCSPQSSKRELDHASALLKKAVCSVIQEAEKQGIHSVAIPALSSGLFSFPLSLCAEIIVFTLQQHSRHNYSKKSSLNEIRLVNHDDKTVNEMEKACRTLLGPSDDKTPSYSGAVTNHTATESADSIRVGNVTVHIKRGSIEDEKANVIVNTVAPDLDLSKGKVSQAILRKAGRPLQQEIKTINPYAHYGDVIKTNGFRMGCDFVYHTVCPSWLEHTSSEILSHIVMKSLCMAETDIVKSIAFPAIGTGNLDFPKDEVAKIMMGQVLTFAEQVYKGSKLDVYFVLYPPDQDTVKAFEKELKAIKGRRKSAVSRDFDSLTNERNRWKDDMSSSLVTNKQGPCVEICGENKEALMEAEKWIRRTLLRSPERLTIQNNHIYYFGQKEHDELSSFQYIYDVSIKEMVKDGKAILEITGTPQRVIKTMLAVEKLCGEVQEEYAMAEENDMLQSLVQWRCADIPALTETEITGSIERAYLSRKASPVIVINGKLLTFNFQHKSETAVTDCGKLFERKCLLDTGYAKMCTVLNGSFYQRTVEDSSKNQHKERVQLYKRSGLEVVKIESINNPLLRIHFELKKNALGGKAQTLYHRVPAQFSIPVCRAGFQRVYSQPEKQSLGAGLYFNEKLDTLMRDQSNDFERDAMIYIFEAQVVTGKTTNGSPDLIVPPGLSADSLTRYDSVSGGTSTHVIFNSWQAYPEYLITCRQSYASP